MRNRVLQIMFLLLFTQSAITGINAQVCDSLERCRYTMEELTQFTPWNLSDNTAGLVYNPLLDYSTVGAYLNSERGSYRNYNTPESMWNAGIYTRSYKKVKDVYFYGDFKYDYNTRLNQTWLGTVIPDFTINPMLDSVPGKVLQESYMMTGKVAYKMNEKLAIGVGMDYNNSTMAKRVDGRNSNVFSALTVKPGVTMKFGDFTTGIDLIYQYWVDRVNYEYIGDESGKNIYYMEGLFFNSKSGITVTTVLDRGYFMNSYGGALQLCYKKNNLELFSQFKPSYNTMNNYEESSLTKRYSREEFLIYQSDNMVKYTMKQTDHFLKLSFTNNDRVSYTIINEYKPVPDEIKSWQYYERDEVMRYLFLHNDLDVSYRFGLNDADKKQNFSVTAGYNKSGNEKIYKIYPDRFSQKYILNTLYLEGKKFFYPGTKNVFEIEAQFATTNGAPSNTMFNATRDGNLGVLNLNMPALVQDYNYNTASRQNYGIGGRYRYIFNYQKGASLDVRLKYNLIKTKDNRSRTYISLAAGYNF